MFKIFSIIILTVFLYGSGCNYKTYIPENAKKYLPIILKEIKYNMPNFEYYQYFPALVEHESCVRLCGNSYWARRCFNPKSRLKTKREEGAGFFQITRVFKKDGRVRWDVLQTLRKRFPKQLHELNWKNIYDRPDLQIKAGILLWKSNMRYFYNIPYPERLWFLDSVYNGGYKYLNYERKKCKLMKNCNPDKWFGNVELVKSGRAKRKLYGNRTAWDINRHHVEDVKNRMHKYYAYIKSKCKNR